MRIHKKIKNKLWLPIIATALILGTSYNSSADNYKSITVRGPSLGDPNSIEERAKASVKIDNIPLDRYKVIKVLGSGGTTTKRMGKITTSGGNLNIREGPGSQYAIVVKLANGSIVEILDSQNGWYKIKTQSNTIGWGSMDYISAYTTSVGNDEITDYPSGTVMGLRISSDGVPYYLPNIGSRELLTYSDKNNGEVKDILAGTKYMSNLGDLYWNYSYQGDGVSKGYAARIGPLDNRFNFKPAHQFANVTTVIPFSPKYPSYTGGPPGNQEAGGRFAFYRDTINTGGKYGGTLRYRNSQVESVANSEPTNIVRGEWRHLGSNTNGDPIENQSYPNDKSGTNYVAGELIRVNYNWQKLSTVPRYHGSSGEYLPPAYNDPNTTDSSLLAARNSTWDRLWANSEIKPKFNSSGTPYVSKGEYTDYFDIGAPASRHLTGSVTGHFWSNSTTRSYVSMTIPADAVLDMNFVEFKIIDAKTNKDVFSVDRNTGYDGMSKPVYKPASGAIKLQPGKEYKYIYKIENRSMKNIYNPTVNLLFGMRHSNSNELLSNPAGSSMYNVYTNEVAEYKKELGKNPVASSNAFFDVEGRRLHGNRNNSSAVPPLNTHIGAFGNYTGVGTFVVPTVDDDEKMNELYGTRDPNGIGIAVASNINQKHQISDETFVRGYDGTETTIDDLYAENNALASDRLFSAQDMRMGGANEYELLDWRDGPPILDKTVIRGEGYSLGVKVYNPNKNWGTNQNLTTKFTIRNTLTGEIIENNMKNATEVRLKANDSANIWIPVIVPLDAPDRITVDVEIHDSHAEVGDDWYKGNNKFSITLNVIHKVDLEIKEAMGDVIGDDLPKEVLVFSGESVNLKAQVTSNSAGVTGPIDVIFKDSSKLAKQIISSIDQNNPNMLSYNFKAPEIAYNQPDKIFEIEAEVNPDNENRVLESSYANNKVKFKVRVTGDITKFGCSSEVLDGTVDGKPINNPEPAVDVEYTSYTPVVTVKRREQTRRFNNDTGQYDTVWGNWYEYPIHLKDAVVYVPSVEKHKIDKVYFKSKYTTTRYAEGKDRDKIDKDGFVDVIEYPEFAKVKAGYGFEIKVDTSYFTDLETKFMDRTSDGINTTVNSGGTVYSRVADKIRQMESANSKVDFNKDKNSMTVKFMPNPRTTTMNAKDETICIKMPDGKIYNSYDNDLVENIMSAQGNVYKEGIKWRYAFTDRNDGMGGVSRKYYLSDEVKNSSDTNKYYMRIGTNKLGVGGLTNAKAYDAKDIEIKVYGGRTDDLKDQDSI